SRRRLTLLPFLNQAGARARAPFARSAVEQGGDAARGQPEDGSDALVRIALSGQSRRLILALRQQGGLAVARRVTAGHQKMPPVGVELVDQRPLPADHGAAELERFFDTGHAAAARSIDGACCLA